MSILIFDKQISDFLSFAQKDSVIAAILLQGNESHIKDEGNYIKYEGNDTETDVISYLPFSKYQKVDDPWSNGRVKIKIGRFVRKFLTEFSEKNFNIDNVLVEKFVNLYKSYFSRDLSNLKVVEGDDILNYYLEDNYHTINDNRKGSLWNSCMRQKERNKFMSLYSKNPNKVKMLVFFTNENKVRARALLWHGVKEHGCDKEYNFMDRIYFFYDHDVNLFKDWAKENGYISKWEQSAKNPLYFDEGTGEAIKKSLYVILDNYNQPYYPYLDTFKFFKYSKGRFSNSEYYSFDYMLTRSNGQRSDELEEEIEEEI